jgi:hypothetical protein
MEPYHKIIIMKLKISLEILKIDMIILWMFKIDIKISLGSTKKKYTLFTTSA